jgi:hypothetical protein
VGGWEGGESLTATPRIDMAGFRQNGSVLTPTTDLRHRMLHE